MGTITRAAVVGFGTMGRRIAHLLLRNGVAVRAFDVTGISATKDLRAQPAEFRVAESLQDCATGADIVIEATSEDLSVKQDVLGAISRATGALIASNTSTFRAGVLEGFVEQPERFVLTHFFNPADVVPLVEVIRAPSTAADTVQTVLDLLHRLGKRPVVAGDVEGFIANRLQAAVLREALSLVDQGLASPEDVDAVVRHGLGPRWSVAGPVGVADLGGLDVWQAVCAQVFPTLNNGSAPPASIVDHVRAGRLGAKSGTGFYDYAEGADRRALAAMEELFTHLQEPESQPERERDVETAG